MFRGFTQKQKDLLLSLKGGSHQGIQAASRSRDSPSLMDRKKTGNFILLLVVTEL